LNFQTKIFFSKSFFQPQITPKLTEQEKCALYPYILNVAIKSNQKDEDIGKKNLLNFTQIYSNL